MKKTLLFLASFVLSAFAGEDFTHDGFFLNVSAGLGYGSFSDKMDYGYTRNPELTSEGLQVETNIKIGGAIINNLILHATLNLNTLFADLEDDAGGSLSHEGFEIFMLGAGLTYYFPQAGNTFISASAGVSNYSVTFDGKDYDFLNLDNGFIFNIAIGKEWWIDKSMGLGVAVSFTHSSATGNYDDVDQDGSSNTFSVVCSFTIN
ncbi:MAG: hypothetical protein HUK20_05915 [Fibrobacter sp.]|mgnify:CR=1 FL=1|nr:hypothetical protein [Fibrobacter sp.]